MKLFNLDSKYDRGFQIDMSQLTEEQRNHVLQIFDARGVKVIPNGCPLKFQWSKQYISLLKEVDGNNMKLWDGGFEDLPLITYPELCRGAVQLEVNTFAVFTSAKKLELKAYAKSIGLKNNSEGRYMLSGTMGGVAYAKDFSVVHPTISSVEFEQKLRGISPVVRETEKQSADNAQCKPKYLKAKEDNSLIVEWESKINHKEFYGRVVKGGLHGWEIGSLEDWTTTSFEPCDYTPTINEGIEKATEENKDKPFCAFEFAEPQVEQPAMSIDDYSNDEVFTSLEDIKDRFEQLVDKTKRLNKENAQLKERIDADIKLSHRSDAQIAKLKEELNLFKNTKGGTPYGHELHEAKQEIERLKNELANIKALPSSPIEPVYDAEWLDKIIQKYVKCYGYPHSDSIVYILIDGKYYSLDPKASAGIIFNALAKELNGGVEANEHITYNEISEAYCVEVKRANVSTSNILFRHAQKAIDILNQHFPEVLKNYFA